METRYLDSREVAVLLKVTPLTLYRWRRAGIGPPCVMVGRHYLYERDRLQQWVNQQPTRVP